MSTPSHHETADLTEHLALAGYWPAQATRLVSEGRYAEAVALCRERLVTDPHTSAGRAIYATALYKAGQTDAASEQFFILLSRDPDNLVALKYLGDMKFAAGDEATAMTYYERIQQLDPHCTGLACELDRPTEQTKTITLTRPAEKRDSDTSRKIPFYTETIGDLYLDQGHPRLAAEVYRVLFEKNANPRLAEKLDRVEQLISRKER
jgi:tetratricopeptide (TPR) repeat protein